MNIYHVDTIVFLILVAIMGIWSFVAPRKEAFVQQDVKAVDMTPWRFSWVAGGLLLVLVALIYASFADLSALKDDKTEPVPYHWSLIATEVAQKEMTALEIDETEQGVIITEIQANIDEFDKSKDKPADTAVTRKIVYQTIGKHYAKAKGFSEAQIAAFNELIEKRASASLKEANDLVEAQKPVVEQAFNDVINGVKDAADTVKKDAEKAADTVKKDADAAADAAKKDADAAADAAKKDGESAVDTVNKGVENVTNSVGNALQGAVDTVNKGVSGVATGITDALGGNKN